MWKTWRYPCTGRSFTIRINLRQERWKNLSVWRQSDLPLFSLAGGSSKLAAGTKQLKSGSSTLVSGMENLKSGSAALSEETGSLKSGAAQLESGAGCLLL
ncbi:hypothetical protein [Blautia luti]|uniref:hypothetical protein n=1 Tax=Blautia TaxID=572511 RepID=UPI0011DDE817|nr:hypothetical protein [Ruminococcus sp.]NSK41403.1 hypothetical protein [Blautia luti]NSK84507.1 hypothetical protein [Blautia luti]NSY31724.1 hypothetical protein [Blautia sp. MSK.21.1]